MNKNLILFFSCLFPCALWAQGLGMAGRHRVVGDSIGTPSQPFGGSRLIGSATQMDTASFNSTRYVWFCGASLSDAGGNLLLYTNGYSMMRPNGLIVPNSDSLVPTSYATQEWNQGNALPQGALMLNSLADSNEVLMFCMAFNGTGVPYRVPLNLFFSRFKRLSADQWVVVEKGTPIINDSLNYVLTACKHGNGRDWWIFAPKWNSNEFHRILLTPSGLQMDAVAVNGSILQSDGATMAFSPDGNYFATYGNQSGFRLFAFDRCLGTFSFLTYFPSPQAYVGGGLCFSPNSQYVYFNNMNYIWRLPLQSNLQASDVQLVHTYTNFQDSAYLGGLNVYWLMEPGLDGKLYINGSGGCRYYATIAHPDAPSVADVGYGHFNFRIPYFCNMTYSNIPYHGLGAKVGSPCDTLSAITDVGKSGGGLLRLFPNPGPGQGTVLYDAVYGGGVLSVCSATGQEVHRQVLNPGSQQAEVQPTQALAPGVYTLCLQAPGGSPGNRIKWVVTQP